MITPKEKAKDLVQKFMLINFKFNNGAIGTMNIEEAKQCALICIYEILDVLNPLTLEYEFWQEVEQELLKIK